MTINNYILSKEQLKKLDLLAETINKIPSIVLMEEAASKIVKELHKDFNLQSEKICIIAGSGNNGGDALSLARKLLIEQINFDLYVFSDETGSELYKTQKTILLTFNQKFIDFSKLKENILNYSLIIDGIFGIGYKPRDNKLIYEIFENINNSQAKIVAIDVPSGLNLNGDPSVCSDYTYSIGFMKDYFFTGNSRKLCGIIKNLKISFSIDNIQPVKKINFIDEIKPLEKKINPFVHKYSRGGVLSIGGSPGKFGSIIYCAETVLKSGAGISTVLTESENVVSINNLSKNLVIDSLLNYKNYIDKYTTIAIGPGLKADGKSINIINDIIKLDKTFILDASFFSIFDVSILKELKHTPILTPHGGELIKFFGKESNGFESNPIKCVNYLSNKYNSIIILKDSFLTIGFPDDETFIYDNPKRILAQAGSGDIFTGLIAGLIAQKISLKEAVFEAIRLFYNTAGKIESMGYKNYNFDIFMDTISKN